MDGRFSDNLAKGRFEFDIGGRITFASYRRQAGRLVILHVEAPPMLRGTGAAGRLMDAVVGVARAEGREIIPYCGYAAAWLRRSKAA